MLFGSQIIQAEIQTGILEPKRCQSGKLLMVLFNESSGLPRMLSY